VRPNLKPPAELAEHTCGGFELGVAQPRREFVDPGRLLLIDRTELGTAEIGEGDELRATMIGVRHQFDQSVGEEAVNGCVHCLAREAHAAGDLGHGERPLRERDSPEHLPARRRQAVLGCKQVACREQEPVGAKSRQDHFSGALSFERSPLA